MTSSQTTRANTAAPEGRLSAAEALAASEARLAEIESLRGRVSRRQWETVFRQMEEALKALARSPLVTDDPEAEGRFRDLAGARNPEELALAFDRFAEHVTGRLGEVVAARVAAGEMSAADAAMALRGIGSGIHTRAPVETSPREVAPVGGDGTPRSVPKRTVLRL